MTHPHYGRQTHKPTYLPVHKICTLKHLSALQLGTNSWTLAFPVDALSSQVQIPPWNHHGRAAVRKAGDCSVSAVVSLCNTSSKLQQRQSERRGGPSLSDSTPPPARTVCSKTLNLVRRQLTAQWALLWITEETTQDLRKDQLIECWTSYYSN